MTITEVQETDAGCFATIDGIELEFSGGEVAEQGDGPCDNCGRHAAMNGDDFETVVYASLPMGDVILCNHCLNAG